MIDCGERTTPVVAPWTPGVNVGKPVDFVDTCYLIKHGADWMVWDTGLPDAIFSAPSSDPNAWKRTKSLAGELDKLGVKRPDVKYVAVSHLTVITSAMWNYSRKRCCWCRRPNTTGLGKTANRASCRRIPSRR